MLLLASLRLTNVQLFSQLVLLVRSAINRDGTRAGPLKLMTNWPSSSAAKLHD